MTDNSESNRSLTERLADVELIENALVRAVREALLRHKAAGNAVPVSRHGQVVWMAPENIPVERDG
ncbi:MAG: hypothetical protein ACRD26_14515 [Vicinamibacterales bacterium]